MSTRTANDLYEGEEFDSWAERRTLLREEELLLGQRVFGLPKESRILDVGTGGGCFIFALHARGFTRLDGIDLSARLVEAARSAAMRRGALEHVCFSRQNVTDLRFADASFDVVLALQQVLSLVETPVGRLEALRQIRRVIKPGGLLLASVLSWEGRAFNPLLAAAIAPLKLLKGDLHALPRNYLPWTRLGGKVNLRFLRERQPYAYWFRREEFSELLAAAGFALIELTTSRALLEQRKRFVLGGMLYAIARVQEANRPQEVGAAADLGQAA